MKGFSIGLLALTASMAYGQQNDSIKTRLLSEIVVQGVKMEGDTLQHFYQSNASTTTENILAKMKGVSLIRRGAYGQEPVFRGLSNGQLNVTIDGMKIFGACTDKMDPVTIYVEPMNLSAIQATMGTQGAEFGSTFGGALNMKLAQPVVGSPGITGQAGIDFQSSAQAVNHFSAFNISKNASAYRANFTYRKSNNYKAGGGDKVPFLQYEKINLATSGKWTVGNHDTLQANVLIDQGWKIGFPALPMDVGKATANIYSVTYRRVSPWFVFRQLAAKVYHNSIVHSMDDSDRPAINMRMDMPGKSTTSGMFVEGDVHLFHEYPTVLKLEYFSNSLLGEMTMYPDEGAPMYMQTAPEAGRQLAGFYLQQQLRINNKSKLMLAVRGDLVYDQIRLGTGLEQWKVFDPSIAEASYRVLKTVTINYKQNLASNFQLDLQGGYGERMPTLNERFGFYLFNRFDGYDYLGDPDLKNETSWNIEPTLNYFGSKVEVQLSPFYQNIQHYIVGQVNPALSSMTIGAKGVKQNINFKSASLSGFDATILARPAPAMQWITTVKYTHGVSASGEALPLIPPLKLVTAIRYERKGKHIQLEYDWSAAQNRVSESVGELSTAAYYSGTIRAGWNFNPSWQINGGVENILDRRYREHLDWGGIPRPGRNMYINVIYKFSST